MTHNKSIFTEIIIRKIPQIIGMYIASVWLAVEISDWMSGRFDLPEQLSTYVFVGMLSFLPTVILLAWGHGKPGKDQWSLTEKVWIPINVVLSSLTLMYIYNPTITSMSIHDTKIVMGDGQVINIQEPLAIMEKMSIVDVQTGSEKTYEVANQAYHQNVISYFWDNKTDDNSLDWMSYGASWLLSQDLQRTPVISVDTPYDSTNLMNQLIDKGFPDALGVPVSLARKVAENRAVKWMIQGSFKKVNDQLELTAHLYDVKTGEQVKTITELNKDWLSALDKISYKLGEVIISEVMQSSAGLSKNIIPQLAIVEHTSNNIDAIKQLISALNHVSFSNEFSLAIENLSSALKLDQSFAEAHVLAMKYYRAMGDFPNAIQQAQKALDLDYKLYQESVFLVKASLFGMQSGQQSKAIKVLENWVKIYPKSAEALNILGNNYIMLGYHQEQAKEVFTKLYELEGPHHDALIKLGKIYRLQNNKEKALEFFAKYLAANPTKGKAYFEMADAYMQFSMLDKAREMYEEAALYDNRDFKAEIGLANIVAARGDYQLAISQLQLLLDGTKTDHQKMNILSSILEILLHTGQLNEALIVHNDLVEPGKKILPPIAFTFQVSGATIIYQALLGDYQQAHDGVVAMKLELKPPFDQVASSFSKAIYELAEDRVNFKKELDILEEFVQSMNMITLKPELLSSKAKLAYWDNDFNAALDLYNQALEMTAQSFVTLITTRQVNEFVYHKSLTLFELNEYQQAIENLDIILARTPLSANAHYLKAKIFHQMEDTEKRDESLKQAHRIWQYADKEYIDYKNLVEFEAEINLVD